MISEGVGFAVSATEQLRAEVGFVPRNIPAAAPTARQSRRALIKAFGIRQYKKVTRGLAP